MTSSLEESQELAGSPLPTKGQPIPVTVAYGNGIGPEIMSATLEIIDAANVRLDLEEIEVGEAVYARGISSGIEPSAWESLRRTKLFLKAPITTPQGGGLRSVNVTIRNALGLFANIRPCPSYAPFVATKHPAMDLVIVRENEEDLYVGVEHRQTADVVHALKLTSRPASERIIRYAFEYARHYGRHKVTCFTKDNILKLTDGLFHQIFDQVSAEYPDIEHEHWIIDIGAALLADTPEVFDVIVLQNLYGDMLSDVAAQITGSIGLGGSANIGAEVAMFEAIHGSAPRIAGQGIANPSGLLLAAVQLLVHVGEGTAAATIHNAWLRTIEDGVHTVDIFDPTVSKTEVSTQDFAQAVIERLGELPSQLGVVSYPSSSVHIGVNASERGTVEKSQVGLDVFFEWRDDIEELLKRLHALNTSALSLKMVSNRAQLVYPGDAPLKVLTDQFRCRYLTPSGSPVSTDALIDLLRRLAEAGLPFVKTDGLFTFDGHPGFSLGQGE